MVVAPPQGISLQLNPLLLDSFNKWNSYNKADILKMILFVSCILDVLCFFCVFIFFYFIFYLFGLIFLTFFESIHFVLGLFTFLNDVDLGFAKLKGGGRRGGVAPGSREGRGRISEYPKLTPWLFVEIFRSFTSEFSINPYKNFVISER